MKQTLLYNEHIKAGAQMVEFSDWGMPLHYGSILEEHKHTRQQLSLFDTCHMGQLSLKGKDALAALQRLVVTDMANMEAGRCRYTILCDQQGYVIDDLVVYKLGEDEFILMVNAGPAAGDFAWLREKTEGMEVSLERRDRGFGKLDLQGPKSRDFLLRLAAEGELKLADGMSIDQLKWYRFAYCELFAAPMILSRTGYTGEMGFELYPPAKDTVRVWRELLAAANDDFPLRPVGLGARDSLRLEMGYPLYGHEHSRQTTLLNVGFGYGKKVSYDKGDFLGRQSLLAQKEAGPKHCLVGLVVLDRGIPRAGAAVYRGEQEIGRVTSGGFAPSLGHAVVLASLRCGKVSEGEFFVKVRDKRLKAELVELPFYKQGSVRG